MYRKCFLYIEFIMSELEIFYNNKRISNNQFLKPSETELIPNVKFNFEPNKIYALIMHDPDSVHGNRIHWALRNIVNNINRSETIFDYKGPSPPPGSGKHRYIFEIYEQEEMIHMKPMIEINIPMDVIKDNLRINKSISKIQFISKNEMGGNKLASPCKGTIYKINGKSYCVGEKTTKIKKGKSIKLKPKNKRKTKRRK